MVKGIIKGVTGWVRDKVEDASDAIGKKITGKYDYLVNCGKAIDIKHGYGDNFKCPNCEYILCSDCATELMEIKVLQNPALFKKGRRQYYLRCPGCGNILWESDIELFR